MSYRIRRDESVGDEIRRILTEQGRRSLRLLQGWAANPRDNVHFARQGFKRIRAALRLVRGGAPYVYRVENTVFRDIGRSLAYARDSEAVIEAVGLLEGRLDAPLQRESLRLLRVSLEQRAARERDCGIHDLAGRIESACAQLAAADRRFRDLPLAGLRRRHVRRGLEDTLARVARGYETARASGRPADLHAWRKDVKYASHQYRLVEDLGLRGARGGHTAYAGLAGMLGHHQDLATLDALLRSQPDDLGVDLHLRAMRNAVRAAQAELAAESLRVGGRLVKRGRPPTGDESASRSRS